jgi:hypothetical protein
VMTTIFLEAGEPPVREPTLSTEAGDEPKLLEGPEVRERRRRAHPKTGRDLFQTGSSGLALASGDDPKRFDLPMRQPLERLHDRRESSPIYIGTPNY